MAFEKGKAKTGGRQKGVPNKNTVNVKAAIESVYQDIGGDQAFAEWAVREPTEFYKLLAKLLPKNLEVSGPNGGAIPTEFAIKFVAPGK